MCVPVVIDDPRVDLSGVQPPTLDPAGTGVVAPATTPPVTPPDGQETLGGGDHPSTRPKDPNTPQVNPAAGGTGDPVRDQNTLLINSLTEMAHHFSDTTSTIIQGQTDAANALKDGFLSLTDAQKQALAAADTLRKNTGQASRKPNYSLSLAANRRANSGGRSSTMLTGVTGVPTNSLALGRAQLLGQ